MYILLCVEGRLLLISVCVCVPVHSPLTRLLSILYMSCDFPFSHSVGGTPHQLMLKLPVFINKFIEEAAMGSADFFSRWKQLAKWVNELSPSTHLPFWLSFSSQEAQKIFTAKYTMDKEFASSKVSKQGVCCCYSLRVYYHEVKGCKNWPYCTVSFSWTTVLQNTVGKRSHAWL